MSVEKVETINSVKTASTVSSEAFSNDDIRKFTELFELFIKIDRRLKSQKKYEVHNY